MGGAAERRPDDAEETFRPSNGTFSVRVDQASIELPTAEGSPSGAFLD